MGLDDFLKKWDSESWKNLEKLEAKRSAPSTSSASTKAKVQKTAGVPAPVTPPEALEAWRRQREEGAQPAKETSVKQATAKEDQKKEEEVKVEVKSEEPDAPDSSSSGFDESEESEDAAPHAKPKVSKRQMEFGFFGYKRRGGGRKKRQAKQNKEQRLARLARRRQ